MSLYNVRKSNSGFTLVELLMTLIIIGVIAVITVPSFLGLLNRNRVNQAAQQVEGALKEAQRQALRMGKQCTININTTTKTISNPAPPTPPTPPTPATNGCLLSTRNLNSSVQLNSNSATLAFSGKGNIDRVLANPAIVVSMPNQTDQRKCIILDGFFGVLRSGDYPIALGATDIPEADRCQ
jgi:prepilin-type N-terminal cleavage/methylation domain-containing protein